METATLDQLQDEFGVCVLKYISDKGAELKRILTFYTFNSFFCYFLDCIAFLWTLKEFGIEGNEKSETIMVFASALFILMSVVFMIWMTQLNFKLPLKLQKGVHNMLFGWGKTIEHQLGSMVNRVRGTRQEANNVS